MIVIGMSVPQLSEHILCNGQSLDSSMHTLLQEICVSKQENNCLRRSAVSNPEPESVFTNPHTRESTKAEPIIVSLATQSSEQCQAASPPSPLLP